MKNNIVINQHSSAQKPLHLQSLIPPHTTQESILYITVPAQHHIHLIDDVYSIKKIIFLLNQSSLLDYQAHIQTKHLQQLEKQIEFHLQAPGGQVNAVYAHAGGNQQSFILTTLQRHTSSQTKSSVLIKGVLSDHAQLTCNNTIFVDKELTDVTAKQLHKNLILDRTVKIKSLPQLEVYSKNAHCSHGATARGLSQEDIFYAQSRGIDIATAKQILINAFLK